MLKTCFGCCPISAGVKVIAIVNMIWNLANMFKLSILRYDKYEKFIVEIKKQNYSSSSNDSNMESAYDHDHSNYINETELEEVSVMSEIFMDYLFMVLFGWAVLEFISNIYLKQSTFKHAPHKIYVWLVIYYANLSFMIVHSIYYATLMVNYDSSTTFLMYKTTIIRCFLLKLMYIAIVGFEILVIHSFYILEKNANLNDFVQLKWKYISRGEVLSKGIDYTSPSTFKAETSRQTQDGSTIPPYITNILQN